MRQSVQVAMWIVLVATIPIVVLLLLSPPNYIAPSRQRVVLGPLAIGSTSTTAHWIHIEAGKIIAVSEDPHSDVPETQIGEGLYATSGLIDMHVHIPPGFLPGNIDFFSLLFLTHGVTSVRELGSIGNDVAKLSAEIELGKRIGPRVFSCGAPLTGSPPSAPFAQSVATADDVKSVIDANANSGADCIKIYRGFPERLLSTARREADSHQLPLVGHLPLRAHWDEDRIADIQHICDPRCFTLRNSAVQSLVEAAKTSHLRHTPTLVSFAGPYRAQRGRPIKGMDLLPRLWVDVLWAPETLRVLGFEGLADTSGFEPMHNRVLEAAKELAKGGVTIQTGSDAPHPFVVPGAALHREMELLHDAGLSLSQVWEAATKVPGDFLPIPYLGLIVPGAPADILLFRDDPMLSLDALSSLEIVIADGRVYRIEELREKLRKQTEYIEGPLYEYLLEPAIRAAVNVAAAHPEWLDVSRSN